MSPGAAMTAAATRWERIRTFCLFVGYGRSGHSAVGSLLDAHPHAAVAHELHAVKRFFEGVPRDVLFDEIFALAQQQAREGRYATRAGGGTYRHNLPGQVKDEASGITLIGDKKGAGTAWQFARHGFEHIDRFKAYIGVPVRILHVVRNPFDIVAAGLARGREDFSRTVAVVSRIRTRCLGADWCDVHYEDLIAKPEEEVARIVTFLGLPAVPDHVAHSVAYLYREPHLRRHEVHWPEGMRAMVDALIDRYDYLGRYRWDR
jgi:hypothetical protein